MRRICHHSTIVISFNNDFIICCVHFCVSSASLKQKNKLWTSWICSGLHITWYGILSCTWKFSSYYKNMQRFWFPQHTRCSWLTFNLLFSTLHITKKKLHCLSATPYKCSIWQNSNLEWLKLTSEGNSSAKRINCQAVKVCSTNPRAPMSALHVLLATVLWLQYN
jgi:hypothetical protein